MVTRGSRKEVDPAQAAKYRRVGASLVESARALAELADDGSRYGNAIGVIVIHACIAFNDALTIAYHGVKSTEGDHTRAADTLVHALGSRAPSNRVRQLRGILGIKDRISYAGAYYSVEEAGRLLESGADFCAWADTMLDRRPPAPLSG